MSALNSALSTASNALDAMERAIGVIQNNVANASTPGYVTQTLQLNAALFNPSSNVWGGVQAGAVTSARSTSAEESVWAANQQVGMASQQSSNLQSLQSLFDISGTSGVANSLSTLYSAFSAWSNSPDSSTAQTQVLNAAQGLAQSFNSTESGIQNVRSQAQTQTQSTLTQINQLGSEIATINGEIRQGGQSDAGLQSQLYNNLEQLSNLVNISAETQSDGTVSVLIDGQVPLVIGQNQDALSVARNNPSGSTSNAAPDQQILTSTGQDITDKVTSGQLGGLLQITNQVIPSLIGNSTQQGSLNQLAESIADRVNGLLTSGQTSSGATGVALFTYTTGSPTSVAQTLSVSSGITASQLAAVDPGPPSVANGIADQLAQLQDPTASASMLNGQSYTDFYSSIAAGVGSLESTASDANTAQTQVLTQAQNARAQLSGVSLNDQAAQLLQFQDAYQASSQALATINSTIQYLMQTMQSVQ